MHESMAGATIRSAADIASLLTAQEESIEPIRISGTR
jgi:hypothetical protein